MCRHSRVHMRLKQLHMYRYVWTLRSTSGTLGAQPVFLSGWAGWRSVSGDIYICECTRACVFGNTYITYIWVYTYMCIMCLGMCVHAYMHTHTHTNSKSHWTLRLSCSFSSSQPACPSPSSSHHLQVPNPQKNTRTWLPGHSPCRHVSPGRGLLVPARPLSVCFLTLWTCGSQWPAVPLQLLYSEAHMYTCRRV